MVLLKFGEYPVDQAVVSIQIFHEDQDVVQVDNDVSLIDKNPQDFIHHPLECGRQIAQIKEHDDDRDVLVDCLDFGGNVEC